MQIKYFASGETEDKRLSKSSSHSFPKGGLVVDIMSIGSKTRLNYQEAQRSTFAKHMSVRFFFNITEDDDADVNCSRNASSR
jgi:hypothetical protein